MTKQPTLLEQAAQIVAAWDEHFAMYAETKREIGELRASYALMEQQVQQMKQRVLDVRAKAKHASAAERAEVEAEIAPIEQDIAKSEAKFAERRQAIDELEVKLEKTWDIW